MTDKTEELEKRLAALEAKHERTVDILLAMLDANIDMANALRESNYATTKARGDLAFKSIEAAVEILRQQEEGRD